MSEIVKTDRPKSLSPEMANRAAKNIADELLKDGHIGESEFEYAVKDIAKHGRTYMDGYKLARELDRYEAWDCALQMVEILDGYASVAQAEIRSAQKEWVEANNIQPPYPVGARVIATWGGRDYHGIVDEIYKYGPAQYCVKADGETGTSRMIVNFEDCRVVAEEVA